MVAAAPTRDPQAAAIAVMMVESIVSYHRICRVPPGLALAANRLFLPTNC